MFKKVILASIALSILGAPLAQARDAHPVRKSHIHKVEPRKTVPAHRWARGQRYGDWRNHAEIRDYKRYGLRKPAPGQRWVKVDNQYLLITAATGLIAGVLAAR